MFGGELLAQTLVAAGRPAIHKPGLGNTGILEQALASGAVDLYPEYTGTIVRELLKQDGNPALDELNRRLAPRGLKAGVPFGFNNTYALAMSEARAKSLGIARISDLASAQGRALKLGLSHEFLQRADGWPALRQAYALAATPTGLDHGLAYDAVAAGKVDVIDVYSTDAKIVALHLLTLRDDRAFFPPYEAAPLTRADLFTRVPLAEPALLLLAGRIDDDAMRRMNYAVEGERRSPAEVASEFLRGLGLSHVEAPPTVRANGLLELLWQRRWITLALTERHLWLTGVAVLASVLIGLPLGIIVSRRPLLAGAALSTAGVLQTIPSIALLAFMLPVFGIGVAPAIAALFLYGLLPILRNTVAGLRSIDGQLIEVGRGLGMRPRDLLWRVELPLAAPVILAGIRTAAVINIGTATLAAFIGAGGLGDPIVTGLTVTDTNLVLSGALPAAALALVVDAALAGVERKATPRGLRL
jgi:osmoprotectant transport system permease protein